MVSHKCAIFKLKYETLICSDTVESRWILRMYIWIQAETISTYWRQQSQQLRETVLLWKATSRHDTMILTPSPGTLNFVFGWVSFVMSSTWGLSQESKPGTRTWTSFSSGKTLVRHFLTNLVDWLIDWLNSWLRHPFKTTYSGFFHGLVWSWMFIGWCSFRRPCTSSWWLKVFSIIFCRGRVFMWRAHEYQRGCRVTQSDY